MKTKVVIVKGTRFGNEYVRGNSEYTKWKLKYELDDNGYPKFKGVDFMDYLCSIPDNYIFNEYFDGYIKICK